MNYFYKDKPKIDNSTCKIPFLNSITGEYNYHCRVQDLSCTSSLDENKQEQCVLGKFVSVRPSTSGRNFSTILELNPTIQFKTGDYELTYWIYMYCNSNCKDNNDFIIVTIKNTFSFFHF